MYPTCLFCFELHLSSRGEQQDLLLPRSPLRNEGEYMAQKHASLQLQVGARSLYRYQQPLTAANFNCRLARTVYGRKQFELAKIHLRHIRYFSKAAFLYWFPKVRHLWPIPVAARSKAWVCGHSLAGVVGSNPAVVGLSLSIVGVVCCKVEVCDGLIRRPEECYRVWCVLSVIVKPRQWGCHGPVGAVVPSKKKSIEVSC